MFSSYLSSRISIFSMASADGVLSLPYCVESYIFLSSVLILSGILTICTSYLVSSLGDANMDPILKFYGEVGIETGELPKSWDPSR